ncbi:putative pyridoxal kinase [Neolecta irregularis DAH-3]|uniref:pyridoxal kinase n=1 Tax=Neolecta irregularis (strain DAH-3) TaxID=1198029 RepID=A0A1U7LI46_NEOID|nr:putative pyridoxal kinase [Neolecta irregularis DAH-3]|eukprot:OLL22201.1 putative pyridoxal kinase [Neolecta irregularis DAH-3]
MTFNGEYEGSLVLYTDLLLDNNSSSSHCWNSHYLEMTFAEGPTEKSILLISSSVVHGSAGCRASTFPLQLLGFECDVLNTVQFSNHTGYKVFKGTKTTATQIREIYEGLKYNGFDKDYSYIYTGYIPGAEGVEAIGDIIHQIKERNSKVQYILDPVMGDDNELYVSEEVIPVYKNLLRTADFMTPNQFEAELLSGVKISSLSTAFKAIRAMHLLYRIKNIIITSIKLGGNAESLFCVGSTSKSDDTPRAFQIEFPLIDKPFRSTGDLFAALLIAQYDKICKAIDDETTVLGLPLLKAAEHAIGSMHGVLQKTLVHMEKELQKHGEAGAEMDVIRKSSELRIVQSQQEILRPCEHYRGSILQDRLS